MPNEIKCVCTHKYNILARARSEDNTKDKNPVI